MIDSIFVNLTRLRSASCVSWQRNAALPAAFAAARRAAAKPLLLTAGRAAIERYLLPVPGPQQQTRSSGVRRPAGWDRHTDA